MDMGIGQLTSKDIEQGSFLCLAGVVVQFIIIIGPFDGLGCVESNSLFLYV